MSRRQKDPLRPLSEAERTSLSRLSQSQIAPAAQVARARALLAVVEGQSYTAAAHLVGREVGDTVARWVTGFNRDGLAAVSWPGGLVRGRGWSVPGGAAAGQQLAAARPARDPAARVCPGR